MHFLCPPFRALKCETSRHLGMHVSSAMAVCKRVDGFIFFPGFCDLCCRPLWHHEYAQSASLMTRSNLSYILTSFPKRCCGRTRTAKRIIFRQFFAGMYVFVALLETHSLIEKPQGPPPARPRQGVCGRRSVCYGAGVASVWMGMFSLWKCWSLSNEKHARNRLCIVWNDSNHCVRSDLINLFKCKRWELKKKYTHSSLFRFSGLTNSSLICLCCSDDFDNVLFLSHHIFLVYLNMFSYYFINQIKHKIGYSLSLFWFDIFS